MSDAAATRARTLIARLGLQPHPEGGWYAEVFRSRDQVAPADRRGDRPGLTTIYFLLTSGQVSRLHRVASDEAWHFYEGDPIELTTCDATEGTVHQTVLGPWDDRVTPVHVVPAGVWQAARPLGAYALVGCSVGPGFDFTDFALLRDRAGDRDALVTRFPELRDLV